MITRSVLAVAHLWLGAEARGDGETLRALAHPAYRYEAAGVALGIDAVADGWQVCRHAFPDLSVTVVDVAADGDVAVADVVWSGSQDGAVLHPNGVTAASGGRIRLTDTVLLLRRRDGRIALERHRGGFLTLAGPLYGARSGRFRPRAPAARVLPLHRCGPRTVHTHLERVYRKLGASDRVTAVLRAQRAGLLAV